MYYVDRYKVSEKGHKYYTSGGYDGLECFETFEEAKLLYDVPLQESHTESLFPEIRFSSGASIWMSDNPNYIIEDIDWKEKKFYSATGIDCIYQLASYLEDELKTSGIPYDISVRDFGLIIKNERTGVKIYFVKDSKIQIPDDALMFVANQYHCGEYDKAVKDVCYWFDTEGEQYVHSQGR